MNLSQIHHFIPAFFLSHANTFSPITDLSKFTAAVWYIGVICEKNALQTFNIVRNTIYLFMNAKGLTMFNGQSAQ